MTPQQTKCLDFITKYHKENRVIPTHVAISEHLGVSRQRATQVIAELVELKKLVKTKRFGLYELYTGE